MKLLALFLLLTAPALATPDFTALRAATVRVTGYPACGSTHGSFMGSGFVIGSDNRYLTTVVTADHLMRHSKCLRLDFWGGQTVQVYNIAPRGHDDTSIFNVQLYHAVVPLKLGNVFPGYGEEIYGVGFPNDLPWVLWVGRIASEAIAYGQGENYKVYAVTSTSGVFFGISGGPVVNASGLVVGMMDAVDLGGIAIGEGQVPAVVTGFIVPL